MSECRICLSFKRNCRSIFDGAERRPNTTYADMITYVANMKISINDGITDQICLPCRKKLRDLYDFKLLILSSNTQLHQKHNSNLKRIQFNDITDVKLEISSASTDDKSLVKEYEDIKMNLRSIKDSMCYKDTTIKKLEPSVEIEVESQPMSVMDFLDTIKEDLADDFDQDFEVAQHGPDSDSDEYLPDSSLQKKYEKKQKTKKKSKLSKPMKAKVLIKPTLIEDLRLVATVGRKPKENKKKRKYNAKEGMCPHCGKIAKNVHSHIKLHSEPGYKCDYEGCSKAFHHRKQLARHMVTHTGIRNYHCDQCVSSFYHQRALTEHMLTHSSIKKYVCDTCKKSYKRSHQLSRHIRTHNSANKSFACELCNMSFFGTFGLNHHMRVHTGERPYNCELCSQPYSYKHDFNRHCLKKHGVFLKRRSVSVMNAEVLGRERPLMAQLMAAARGAPAPAALREGRLSAVAYELAVRTFRSNPDILGPYS